MRQLGQTLTRLSSVVGSLQEFVDVVEDQVIFKYRDQLGRLVIDQIIHRGQLPVHSVHQNRLRLQNGLGDLSEFERLSFGCCLG